MTRRVVSSSLVLCFALRARRRLRLPKLVISQGCPASNAVKTTKRTNLERWKKHICKYGKAFLCPTLWERWVKASAYIAESLQSLCCSNLQMSLRCCLEECAQLLGSAGLAIVCLVMGQLDKRSKWPVKTRDLKLAKRLNWRMICRCIVYIPDR